MIIAYFVCAGVTALLWTPLLLKFYRSWIERHNPISLAICATIILVIWFVFAGIWAVTKSVDYRVIAFVSAAISMLVALYAHLAFYWARKLPEIRKKE